MQLTETTVVYYEKLPTNTSLVKCLVGTRVQMLREPVTAAPVSRAQSSLRWFLVQLLPTREQHVIPNTIILPCVTLHNSVLFMWFNN
jgi:hypothetical protein